MKLLFLVLLCTNCAFAQPIMEGNNLRTPNTAAAQLYAYIKTKYQHIINGRECIYYPAANPKRLVITFGYAIVDRYAMWTWFWRKDEQWIDTAYLFLKDDDLCWYLGNNAKPAFDDYCHMINHFVQLSGVPKDHVFTAGGSMGGYAAILFATVLEFKGAIVDIPTVRRDIWQTYQPPNTTKIKSQDRWIDLDAVLARHKTVPLISLHHGRNKADVVAAHALFDVIIDRSPLIIYRTTSKSAHSVFTITKASLEADIAYMERYEPVQKIKMLASWPYQVLDYSDSQFTFGYGNTAYQAAWQACKLGAKGMILVHPCKHGVELEKLREKIASLDALPFACITYDDSSCACAYDVLKIIRDKIGCFTLRYMPKSWQMNQKHLENMLNHLVHQKSLQLPHFV